MIFRTILPMITCVVVAVVLTPSAGLADRGLYEQKCGRCHAAYEPSDFTADEWPSLLLSMKAKAGLTPEEERTLVDWLSEESGDEKRVVSGPVLGGYLYTEYFETEQESKNYDIHYLAISLTGRAAANVAYLGEFEFEHGGTGEDVFVEQAWLDYWFVPRAAVKVGAILTPFNRFDDFHDPLMNYAITRPLSASVIGVSAWKDVGVDLHGYVNIGSDASVAVDLYTVNGLGAGADLRGSRQYRDNNEDKAFGGRLNVLVGDHLEVGGSAYHGAWDDAGDLDLDLFGAHGILRTPWVEVYGEYADGTSQNPPGTADGNMSGFFVQASRLFLARYRPTVRFGGVDYLDEGNAFGRDSLKGNLDRQELAVGFAFYPARRVVLKAEATFFMEGDRVTEEKNDQFGLQAAVRF